MKVIRNIVQIDEDLCDGCGLCIPSCHEGAIEIINNKAKLLAEKLCDGLGDCLGECPQGAINIIQREADDYSEEAVQLRQRELGLSGCPSARPVTFGSCPGSMPHTFEELIEGEDNSPRVKSSLRQWPVQLALLPTTAPFFNDTDLLLAADCVPIAYPNFHQDLLKGKAVAIACPKLDQVEPYIHKLAQILKNNRIESIIIARMEVPCCSGLSIIAKRAIELAGLNTPIIEKIIHIQS